MTRRSVVYGYRGIPANLELISAWHIEVDGVVSSRGEDIYGGYIFSIKPDVSDNELEFGLTEWEDPYKYEHDGYEIDEEAWLKEGIITSKNPNVLPRKPYFL